MTDVISRRGLVGGAFGLAGAMFLGRRAVADELDEVPSWTQCYLPPSVDHHRGLLVRIVNMSRAMEEAGKVPYELRLHPSTMSELRHVLGIERFSPPHYVHNHEYPVDDPYLLPLLTSSLQLSPPAMNLVEYPLNPPGSIEIAYHDQTEWEGATA